MSAILARIPATCYRLCSICTARNATGDGTGAEGRAPLCHATIYPCEKSEWVLYWVSSFKLNQVSKQHIKNTCREGIGKG